MVDLKNSEKEVKNQGRKWKERNHIKSGRKVFVYFDDDCTDGTIERCLPDWHHSRSVMKATGFIDSWSFILHVSKCVCFEIFHASWSIEGCCGWSPREGRASGQISTFQCNHLSNWAIAWGRFHVRDLRLVCREWDFEGESVARRERRRDLEDGSKVVIIVTITLTILMRLLDRGATKWGGSVTKKRIC